MQTKRWNLTRLWAVFAVVVLLGGVGRPQLSRPPQQPLDPNQTLPGLGPDLPASTREKQAKMQNEERQKRLVDDTAKLLALATQLHEDVAKTDKNILSIDVVRRAEEIEKLARSVKERMRG